MSISWPISLQQVLNEDSFSFKGGDTVLRSDTDTGPNKVRRRFTNSIDTMSASINITSAEYTTFINFFDITLNGGVNVFQLNHPITGVLSDWRFIGSYTISSIRGGNFKLGFNLELM